MHSTNFSITPSVIAPDLSDVRHPMLANRYPPLFARAPTTITLRSPGTEYTIHTTLSNPQFRNPSPIPYIHGADSRSAHSHSYRQVAFYRRLMNGIRHIGRSGIGHRERREERQSAQSDHNQRSNFERRTTGPERGRERTRERTGERPLRLSFSPVRSESFDYSIPRFATDHHSDLGVVPIRRDSVLERERSYRSYRHFQNRESTDLSRTRSQAAPISPILSNYSTSPLNMSPTIYSPPRSIVSPDVRSDRFISYVQTPIVHPIDPIYNRIVMADRPPRSPVAFQHSSIRSPISPSRIPQVIRNSNSHSHDDRVDSADSSSGNSSSASFYSFENNDTPEDKLIGYQERKTPPNITPRGMEMLKLLGFKDGKFKNVEEDRSKIDNYLSSSSKRHHDTISTKKKLSGELNDRSHDKGLRKNATSVKYSPISNTPSPYELPTLSPLSIPSLPINSGYIRDGGSCPDDVFQQPSPNYSVTSTNINLPVEITGKDFQDLLKHEYKHNRLKSPPSVNNRIDIDFPSSHLSHDIDSAGASGMSTHLDSDINAQLISLYNVSSGKNTSVHSPQRIKSSYAHYIDFEDDYSDHT